MTEKTIFEKNVYLPRNVWARDEKPVKTHIVIDSNKAKFNPNYHKDDGLFKGYRLIDLKDGKELLDVRWYCPNSDVYCCFWLEAGEASTRGTGRAGGYGYNKTSAAFNEAIENSGIKNFPTFSGSGCNEEAIQMFAKILGVKRPKIVAFYA